MMTKKDFEKTAAILKSRIEDYQAANKAPRDAVHELELQVAYATVSNLAYDFGDAYMQENPRFDRARFLDACGALR